MHEREHRVLARERGRGKKKDRSIERTIWE